MAFDGTSARDIVDAPIHLALSFELLATGSTGKPHIALSRPIVGGAIYPARAGCQISL